MNKNPFAAPPTSSKSRPSSSTPERMWFTPWTSFGLTATIVVSFACLAALDNSDVDLPRWFANLVLGYVTAAGFLLFFLTLVQIMATVADFFTNRMRRACISLFSAILGAATIAIIISS